MAQEMAKERDRFDVANIVMVPLVVQAHSTPRRADRDARDHRDAIVALRVPQYGRLAARCPGPRHGRREHGARFDYENEG